MVIQGAEDQFVEIYIFRKSNGQTIQTIVLPQVTDTFVTYSIVECSSDALETRRLYYSREISLSPTIFYDPEGYYAVWERCCRNMVINNIIAPDAAGQTFLLHFPPVVKDDEPFVNSSPVLFPPLRDYACVNQFYFAEFAGEDPDGDSLAYSLTTPLSTSTIGGGSFALPIPTNRFLNYNPRFNLFQSDCHFSFILLDINKYFK